MALAPRLPRRSALPLIGLLVSTLAVLGPVGSARAARPIEVGDTLLSGSVTGAGKSLANVWVTVTPVNASGNPLGAPMRQLTDAAGSFQWAALPFSRAKLQARAPLVGGLVDTYWPGAYSMATAGILELTSGHVEADIDLPRGGSVTGVIIASDSGEPVQGALVSATIDGSPSTGFFGSAEPVEDAGHFAISGLPPVPMLLLVRLPPESSYLAPPYGWGSSPEDLRIDGARDTEGVVVEVGPGAEIRGTVRDETGDPVPGVEVMVTQCLPACPRSVVTDDTGAYRLTAIPPGSGIRVFAWGGPESRWVRQLIDPEVGPQTVLLPEWFSGQESEQVATPVTLRAGEVRTLDFQLTRGALITVYVRGSRSGEPLSGVITLLKPVDDAYGRHFAQQVPDDPGRLIIGPVAPGAYTLGLNPGTANPGYLPVVQFVDETAAPQGIITLAAGERIEVSVELQAVPGTTPTVDSPQVAGTSIPGSGEADGSGSRPGLTSGPFAGRSW